MGTEYYLYNHQNATVFELGKGPWFLIENKNMLHIASHFVAWLKENWGHSATSIKYHKILAKAVKDFSEGTPDSSLEVWGDCGEELGWAGSLGYVCTGSRYSLSDPVKNRECVSIINELILRLKNDYLTLTDKDREYLITKGWNFKNYAPKL